MATVCILNESLPVLNYSCPNGGNAYLCSCDIAVTCCERMDCPDCYESSDSETLFSFSWPLVAGWYIMLVILFCLGRRGRVGDHVCWLIGWRRRRTIQNRAENLTDDSFAGREHSEIEFTPIVKTRKLEGPDLETEDGEQPVCTICLNQFEVDDIVAHLECQHLYHEQCILPWLRRKATCPLCAAAIDLENDFSTARPRSSSRLLLTLSSGDTDPNIPPPPPTPPHPRSSHDNSTQNAQEESQRPTIVTVGS